MAIDTDNKKFALISYQQPWNTPLPSTAVAFTQGDLQHLLWDYPGIEWAEAGLSATYADRFNIRSTITLVQNCLSDTPGESPISRTSRMTLISSHESLLN